MARRGHQRRRAGRRGGAARLAAQRCQRTSSGATQTVGVEGEGAVAARWGRSRAWRSASFIGAAARVPRGSVHPRHSCKGRDTWRASRGTDAGEGGTGCRAPCWRPRLEAPYSLGFSQGRGRGWARWDGWASRARGPAVACWAHGGKEGAGPRRG